MYSDLDKKAKGGYIIEDALDIAEVFATALNTRKGQIFYGRQYGVDFERYLQKLKEPNTMLSIQSDLYHLRDMDGRLAVDPSQTKLFSDTEDSQMLSIQVVLNVGNLAQVMAEALIEVDEVEPLDINDYINQGVYPWKTEEYNND